MAAQVVHCKIPTVSITQTSVYIVPLEVYWPAEGPWPCGFSPWTHMYAQDMPGSPTPSEGL